MYNNCKNEFKTHNEGEVSRTFSGTGLQRCMALSISHFQLSSVYDFFFFFSLEMYENIYWFRDDWKKLL